MQRTEVAKSSGYGWSVIRNRDVIEVLLEQALDAEVTLVTTSYDGSSEDIELKPFDLYVSDDGTHVAIVPREHWVEHYAEEFLSGVLE